MFDYESGVGVALLLWLWSMLSLTVRLNSQFERNLRKIGYKTSWLWRVPTAMVDTDLHASFLKKSLKFVAVFGLALPFVLLGWIQVAIWLALVVHSAYKDFGAPAAVREYRWKLKNIDMSLEEIVRAGMKAKDQSPEQFDEVFSATVYEMRERGLV